MILRLTQKTALRLKQRRADLADIDVDDPMREWYVNVVVADRIPLLLFTHAASLFSFWTRAAGVTSGPALSARFRDEGRDVLAEYGFPDRHVDLLLGQPPDILALTVDKGVLGSMVDYAAMLRWHVAGHAGLAGLSRRRLNDIANECPMSRIGGKPRAWLVRRLGLQDTNG